MTHRTRRASHTRDLYLHVSTFRHTRISQTWSCAQPGRSFILLHFQVFVYTLVRSDMPTLKIKPRSHSNPWSWSSLVSIFHPLSSSHARSISTQNARSFALPETEAGEQNKLPSEGIETSDSDHTEVSLRVLLQKFIILMHFRYHFL